MADGEWQESESAAPPRVHHDRVFRSGGSSSGRGYRGNDSGRREYDSGRRDYDSGRREFDSGRRDFDSGRREYDSGRRDYDSGRRDNANWRQNDRSDRNDRNPGNFNRNRRTDDRNRKVITIPSSKVGRVIGKGGSKIRELEYEADAKIQINNDNSGRSETEITLIGSDEAINKVEDLITTLIEDKPPPQWESAGSRNE